MNTMRADAIAGSLASARGLLPYLLRDLRGSLRMRSLWVFCASLFLGITLIAACIGLLNLVRGGLDTQERLLFGGDLEVAAREPLSSAERGWLEARGQVSVLLEVRTMLGTDAGDFTVVELQSVDDAYPLYGSVRLEPALPLAYAVDRSAEGLWGAAFDPVLADQLDVELGDRVTIGDTTIELRALIMEQPDRSLRADVRGPPVIVADGALNDSGLLQPGSVVDYDYRVRTTGNPEAFRDALFDAFPAGTWEVRTVDERGEIIGRRLDQVASVLLLIGVSTLLIGGLGVANSIGAYLQSKLRNLATLQSLGARSVQVAFVCIGQTALLAFVASTLGALCGSAIAWIASRTLSERLPVASELAELLPSTLTSILFGLIAALAFALPSLGRALTLGAGKLLRGTGATEASLPDSYRKATLSLFSLTILLFLLLIPEPLVGLIFVGVMLLLFIVLEGLVRWLRRQARSLGDAPWVDGRFAVRMALASLHHPGAPLRPMLLSLGISLTLLVASALIITATLRLLNQTLPARAPALAFYDIRDDQLADFRELVQSSEGHQQILTTPLVLGRLQAINGEPLAANSNRQQAREANDEQKFSYRTAGIDNTTVDRGAWWSNDYHGPPLVAMEDREADQAGVIVGDRLTFSILGETLDAELVAIYSQANFETRFWLEAVFTDGALDPWVTRYVGSAFLDAGSDVPAMRAIGAAFPNVVTLRTARALAAVRKVIGGASVALGIVAAVSLMASILVMASVVAVNRQRQVHEASILHAMGTRLSVILRSALFEYALLGAVLILFATLIGTLLGRSLLVYWLKLPVSGPFDPIWFVGLAVATGATLLCLSGGAWWLRRTLLASPASLLRRSG